MALFCMRSRLCLIPWETRDALRYRPNTAGWDQTSPHQNHLRPALLVRVRLPIDMVLLAPDSGIYWFGGIVESSVSRALRRSIARRDYSPGLLTCIAEDREAKSKMKE